MATTFTVHIDWDRDGSFDGPPAGNRLLNGDFGSGEDGWSFWGDIVHSVSGGKLGAYRSGDYAAFYQMFDYQACAGDTVSITFKVANTSGLDKTFDVILRGSTSYEGLVNERFTVLAGATEAAKTVTGTISAAWATTMFEISIVSDDNEPALAFDDISVTLTHNWDAITAYTRRVKTWAGYDEAGAPVAAGGRCTLLLDNRDRRFSPGNTGGPLYGKLLPRREVRVQASDGASTWTLFRGYVETITPQAGAFHGDSCEITCVDGIALLARQQISVPYVDSRAVDAAVADVVGAAYTPPDSAYADNGDTLTHYGRSWQPERMTALAALREICTAVYGRFYAARDGTATYITRGDRQDPSVEAVLVVGGTYADRVLAVQADHLIGYWRLNEAGGVVAADSSPYGHDADANGLVWGADGVGDGATGASLDGINDNVTLSSAGLSTAFDGAAGTVMVWARVADTSLWTDGLQHGLVTLRASGGTIFIRKESISNLLRARYVWSGGSYLQINASGMDTAGWFCVAMTWDKAADEVKLFVDGAQVSTTQSGMGTWEGALSTENSFLGAYFASSIVWHGDLAHGALWNVALTPDEIAALAVV